MWFSIGQSFDKEVSHLLVVVFAPSRKVNYRSHSASIYTLLVISTLLWHKINARGRETAIAILADDLYPVFAVEI